MVKSQNSKENTTFIILKLPSQKYHNYRNSWLSVEKSGNVKQFNHLCVEYPRMQPFCAKASLVCNNLRLQSNKSCI
jgi:hypothetical protein